MSTFHGVVEEFPRIRIDNFRKNPDAPRPLACFLSHVHSDHLQGLESLRSPFVYCSAATREILLRIEKYPHRMNFSKGILEFRKQHYKHLATLLRPIPLQVPTEIELMPGNSIRVTLFDANHCPGSVMFLIEGGGKSILYTGDIRAEAWWVDSLIRNPVLIPYTLGDRPLDKIYLDTTFAIKTDIYEDFPSKAEGIRELLGKVKEYPQDTVFYLRNWTFGYEEVWLALSAALDTKIHIDQYQLGLYKSLAARGGTRFGVDDALYLCGFTLGHSHVPGCLTDKQSARVHSCEPGATCSQISSSKSVFITPIVSRTKGGHEIPEIGAGGGKGDLEQSHELELPDDATLQLLLSLCKEQISDPKIREETISVLSNAYQSENKSIPLDEYGMKEEEEITLKRLIGILSRGPKEAPSVPLPDTIRFPYSRHSSYSELCLLVKAFKPKDVYPCTVNPNTWSEKVSMQHLFGHLCSDAFFSHDETMRDLLQTSDFHPHKRLRRESDYDPSSFSSTQESRDLDTGSQKSSTIDPTHIDETILPPPDPKPIPNPPHANQDHASPDMIEITDLPFSFPSQLTSQSTSSPLSRFQAIKQAMLEKSRNNEIDFHLSPSFADSLLSAHTQSQEEEEQNPDNTTNLQLFTTSELQNIDLENDTESIESSISLSPPEFDSQETTSSSSTASYDQTQSSELILVESSMPEMAPSTPTPAWAEEPRQSVRRQARIAAYRAARKGTFDAWSNTCSLLTVGDNHSEREIEL